MPHKVKHLLSFCFLCIFLSISQSASTAEKPRVLWPPDDPKIEFIGTYASEKDLPYSRDSKTQRINRFLKYLFSSKKSELLIKPFGIVSDGTSTVYVTDLINGRLISFDFESGQVVNNLYSHVLERPLGLDIDKSGRLYVADGSKRRIVVFEKPGNLPRFIQKDRVLENPAYVKVNNKLSRIYVSDGRANKIHIFTTEGLHIASFGSKGTSDGQLWAPQGLALDNEDRLYVADMLNSRIQVFDKDGAFLFSFGRSGSGYWDFENPKDIALASDGTIYIIDTRKALLLHYTKSGTFKFFLGDSRRSSHNLGFSLPTSIHIDEKDRIYISDYMNARFSVFQHLSEDILIKNPITPEESKELLRRLQEIEDPKSSTKKPRHSL